MAQIFPFFAWLAVGTSAVLLVVLRKFGDMSGRAFTVHLTWFLTAAYCQFLGSSTVVTTSGLVLQTILAVYLLLRWRIAE